MNLPVFALAVGALLPVGVAEPAVAEGSGSTFEREVRLLSELLALAPGACVADIGAGEGRYAIALTRVVGASGTVYATELEEKKRRKIAQRARKAGAPDLRVVAAEPDATGLPGGSCNAAFLRGVYHHVTAPEPFLASLYRTLRPGGRVVFVDFPPTIWLSLWTPKGVPADRGGHGIPPEVLAREARAAGFVSVRTVRDWPASNFVTRNYALVFERPAE